MSSAISKKPSRINNWDILFWKLLKKTYAEMLIPRNRRKPANMSRSLSLCLSSPTACSFCLLAFTDDRPASSPGVTWHAVVVWFSASAGDVNLFCLWLSFAAGCLSLFFEQIRSDGFHNRISAAVTLRNTEKLRSAHTSDISVAYTLALVCAQRSMKKLN